MAVLETQEAHLPVQRSDHHLLRDLVCAQDVFVHPPKIVTSNGQAINNDRFYAVKVLQNVGTVAVFWRVGAEIGDINSYHGVLKAGAAADDGNGGVVDLSRIRGAVWVWSVGGAHRVAVFLCTAPEGASQAAKSQQQ